MKTQNWKRLSNVSERATSVFVFALWGILTFAAVYYVARYCQDMPQEDGFALSPYVSGKAPVTLEWLWVPHNEHRIPLPRLVLIGLTTITDGNFRSWSYCQVGLLSIASLMAMRAASRLRGHASPADIFFPLLFLNWGHAKGWLLGFQVSTVMPAVLWTLLFMAFTARREHPRPAAVLGLGFAVALLPLCGGSGVIAAILATTWLVYAGATAWQRGERRHLHCYALSVVVPVLVLFLYFVSLPRSVPEMPSVSMLKSLSQYLSMSLGTGGRDGWPIAAVALWSIIGATSVALGTVAIRVPAERLRTAGIALGILAVLVQGVAVWRLRSGNVPSVGFSQRYVVLATPILAIIYTGSLASLPRRLGRALRLALLALVLLALPSNMRNGLELGKAANEDGAALVEHIVDGLSPMDVALRHRQTLHPDAGRLATYLRYLHGARLGPFRVHEWNYDPSEFYMFDTQPTHCSSEHYEFPSLVDDESVYVVVPEGELVFDIPKGASSLRGRFGMVPESWQDYDTDGVLFSVEIRTEQGESRVLFERYLDPEQNEEHRGFHPLDIDLAPAHGDVVILRTSNRQHQSTEGDGSFWTDVAIQ